VDVLETKVTLMEGGPERMLKTWQQMADHLYDIKETIGTGPGAWPAIAGIAAVAGSVGALHRFHGRRPGNRSRRFPVGRRLPGTFTRADACQTLYVGVDHAEPAWVPFYVGTRALVVSHTGRSIPRRRPGSPPRHSRS
jgi:hypothetical protein